MTMAALWEPMGDVTTNSQSLYHIPGGDWNVVGGLSCTSCLTVPKVETESVRAWSGMNARIGVW